MSVERARSSGARAPPWLERGRLRRERAPRSEAGARGSDAGASAGPGGTRAGASEKIDTPVSRFIPGQRCGGQRHGAATRRADRPAGFLRPSARSVDARASPTGRVLRFFNPIPERKPPIKSKTTLFTLLLGLARGTLLHFSNTPIVLGERSYKAQELADRLTALAKLLSDVIDAREGLETALKAAAAQAAATLALIEAYSAVVQAAFGQSATILGDFGLKPRKPRTPLTAAEEVAAIAKRDATRGARHTMGSRQRLAIHGDVSGVTITPVVEPAEAPQTATPPAAAHAAAEGKAPAAG